MITKAQEIEILNEAIARLGADSYLAPWLSAVKDEVASMIASDIFPDVRLTDAADQVAKAQVDAKAIQQVGREYLEDAKRQEAVIRAEAHKLLSDARNCIERAKMELSHL